MKTIIRVLKSILVPHKPSAAENDFIEINSKHWTAAAHTANGPLILVESALTSPASMLEKYLIAKTLERRIGATTLVLLNAFYRRASPAYLVARSFGLRKFFCWWRGYLNPWLVAKCVRHSICIIHQLRTGDRLLKLELADVHVGDLLYDTLIRYKPNSYTVGELRFRAHFRLIFRAVFNFEQTWALFERHPVRAVVTSHNVYAEFGILCRIAHKKGARIFLKDMDVFRTYTPADDVYEHFLKVSAEELDSALKDPNAVEAANQYFDQRLGGAIDQVDLKNAYGGKKAYGRAEFMNVTGACPSKPSVFVLAHAFSDAPHVGGPIAFDDYYDWLRQSIIELAKIQDVNVFVKPHPSSYMWGEKGAVERLLEELGITNVFITPKDFSAIGVKSIADYIVTARGTAGLEYSGAGIPAIICAEGYYSGFGIAIESADRDQYFNTLRSIMKIERLPPLVAQRARVLLHLTFTKLARSSIAPSRHLYPGDDADRIIPEQFAEMSLKLRIKGNFEDRFLTKLAEAIDRAF